MLVFAVIFAFFGFWLYRMSMQAAQLGAAVLLSILGLYASFRKTPRRSSAPRPAPAPPNAAQEIEATEAAPAAPQLTAAAEAAAGEPAPAAADGRYELPAPADEEPEA